MYVSSTSSVSRCTGVAVRRATRRHRRGIGDQATAISSTLGGTAASILALSPATGPAAPFVAAAAALVGIIGNLFHGCGNTCIQATQYANQAGAQLDTLKAQYFALPVPRPYAAQQAYLQAVTQIVNWLQQMCGNPALGAAGQRCISERLVRGGTAPWCPTHTGCDYWSTFYDPVANDPDVAPPPSPAAAATSSVTSAISSALPASVSGLLTASVFGLPLWLIGAGGLALLWAVSE